jgi:hypothetical protein
MSSKVYDTLQGILDRHTSRVNAMTSRVNAMTRGSGPVCRCEDCEAVRKVMRLLREIIDNPISFIRHSTPRTQ